LNDNLDKFMRRENKFVTEKQYMKERVIYKFFYKIIFKNIYKILYFKK